MVFGRRTMTLDELEATAAFKTLNDQQRSFVRAYAQSGDQFWAFAQAYDAPDPETARKGSYAVMQRASVKNAIDTFLMKTEKELFIEEVARVSRSKKIKPSQIRALELRARLQFGVDIESLQKESSASPAEVAAEPVAPEAPKEFNRDAKYEVGTRVLFKGQVVVITKVSAEGRAQSYEPADKTEAAVEPRPRNNW
jgi:hypothetical protein